MNKEKRKNVGFKALKYVGWTAAAGFILFQTHNFAYHKGHINGTVETREACTQEVQGEINMLWHERDQVMKRNQKIRNYDTIYPYLQKELIELEAKEDLLDEIISDMEYIRRDIREYNPYE